MKPLTEYENVVLRSIVGSSRRGSGWADPPRTAEVEAALRNLANHKMIVCKPGEWWMVRATSKAMKHIAARKAGKPHRAKHHAKDGEG